MGVGQRGPRSYQNWRAYLRGDKQSWGYEVPLYTDATDTEFVPPASEEWGPYKLYNTLARPRATSLARSLFHLRVRYCLSPDQGPVLPRGRTDVSEYHGGNHAEEIVALLALLWGVRLQPGGICRIFLPTDPPEGFPFDGDFAALPTLPTGGSTGILPGVRDIDRAQTILVNSYPDLGPSVALALSRAALAYKDALWVAEWEPQLSWLLLVAAIEAVAKHCWPTEGELGLEELPELHPALAEVLGRVSEDSANEIAGLLAPIVGSRRKFFRFIEHYFPGPPSQRPPERGRLEWTFAALKKDLGRIYGHRSVALHEATAFPMPLLEPPEREQGWQIPAERFMKVAYGSHGGRWRGADLGLPLHVFEHIVRGAILRWWGQVASVK